MKMFYLMISESHLKQHKDNPVNWQMWSEETLQFSKKSKNLFY